MSLSASSRMVIKSGFRYLRSPFSISSMRCYSVGDKIPINFLKDVPVPEILEDKEYPDWLFNLLDKQPTKMQLLKKIEEKGLQAMTSAELRRVKKLINKESIKTNNSSALEDES